MSPDMPNEFQHVCFGVIKCMGQEFFSYMYAEMFPGLNHH